MIPSYVDSFIRAYWQYLLVGSIALGFGSMVYTAAVLGFSRRQR